jgi:ribosomal protein S18 acetylase RimI-like enzyme
MKMSDIDAISRIDRKITKRDRKAMWKSLVLKYLKLDGKCCLVAELDGTVIGFMFGSIKDWMFGVEKVGWIETLGVDPEFMGQGLGKKMGEELFAYFRKNGVTEVHTLARWDSSDVLAFFKSLGFSPSDFISLRRKL